jgi:NADP-dependent 3-hydroxy acid dehydrogenase YdfG
MAKTWLITGCSAGFGRVVAAAALARGDNVVATARRPEMLKDLVAGYSATARVTALDVTKEGDAAAAVNVARSDFGRLDILVNNAGTAFLALSKR